MADLSVRDIDALPAAQLTDRRCDTYWGGHGCDRPAGHDLPHVCGLGDEDGACSINDGTHTRYIVVADDSEELVLSESYECAAYTMEPFWGPP